MIVAIDGAGPDSSDDYAREMGGSLCSQIGRAANAIYRKPETDRDAQTVRPPPARPGRGSALPSPMAEQMKTLLILTTMIGLSGCVNDQSKLSKGTHVPSSGFGGGFG